MSNDFIQNEALKTINDSRWEYPLNLAMTAANIAANLKGENLKIFDMTKSSSLCDFNILASVQNPMQARSVTDALGKFLRAQGKKVYSLEGYETGDWILLDAGDAILHVFTDSAREVYDLDDVFGDNPQVEIPQEFYFGTHQAPTVGDEHLKGFF